MHKAPGRIHRLVVAQILRQIAIKGLTIPPQRRIARVRGKGFSHIDGEAQARARLVADVGGRETAFGGQGLGGRIGLVGDALVEAEAGEGGFGEGGVGVGVVEEDVGEEE